MMGRPFGRSFGRALGDAATMLLASALGLVVEIVAGRLLAPHVGMSLYSWTAVIAVVLGGFALGHWWGGALAGRAETRARGHAVLAWLLAGCALTTLLALPLLRGAALLLDRPEVAPAAAMLGLALSGFLAPSVMAGTVSPLVTALALRDPGAQPGPVLGRMFALSALGAIAGTLLAGFVFVAWIGSAGTLLATAALYALLAAGHGWAAWGGRGAVALLALALLPAGAAALPSFATACQRESGYFCLREVDVSAELGAPARLMVLDHLAHGVNLRDAPTVLAQPYLHLADELMVARGLPAAPRAFFAGGGAFTLPRAWAADYPDAALTVAELDPAVTRFARDRFWLAETPALRVLTADGRAALQRLPAAPAFDLVFADAFHDIAMPVHLVSVEWHRAVAARLNPGGAYLAHVLEDRRNPRLLLALARSLREAFPVVEVWVETAPAAGRRVSYLLLASDAPTPLRRLGSRRGPSREWALLPPEFVAARIAAAGVPLLTDDFAPVDRLLAHLLLAREAPP
jgi:spermidine synthase